MAHWRTEVSAIMEELDCDFDTAKKEYYKRSDAKAGKAKKPAKEEKGNNNEKDDGNSESAADVKFDEKAKGLVSALGRQSLNAGGMEMIAREHLGKTVIMHRAKNNPREVHFMVGKRRVPREGMFPVKV